MQHDINNQREPQIIPLPKPKPPTKITGKATEKWVAFPYSVDEYGDIRPKISMAACQWIIEHCLEADYNFASPDYLLVHHYASDGVEPPNEWKTE